MSSDPSTTLADLFTPPLFTGLSSAVGTSLRSRSNDEFDEGVAYGRQAWLGRRTVDLFFPPRLCETTGSPFSNIRAIPHKLCMRLSLAIVEDHRP